MFPEPPTRRQTIPASRTKRVPQPGDREEGGGAVFPGGKKFGGFQYEDLGVGAVYDDEYFEEYDYSQLIQDLNKYQQEGSNAQVTICLIFVFVVNPFLPDCKTTFSRICYIFLC